MKQKGIYYFIFLLVMSAVVFYFASQKRVDKTINPDSGYYLTKNTAEPQFMNLNDSVTYVGIEKCAECHADQYKKFITTGMGQSWGLATKEKSASILGTDKLFDTETGYQYFPHWKGEEMVVSEKLIYENDTLYQKDYPVNYIVGSGQHTNSHIRSVNGYLYQVPFTFYTQQKILDFPPGFEHGNNARFSRPIGFECISCHNAYPQGVEGSVNKYDKIPLGINCERCHGPGSLHVKYMELGYVVNIRSQTDYTIVNPRKLSPALQSELCMRCHDQGNSVLKEGKSFFDFKPGMRVSDVLDVFREVYENDDDAFWMETHPERLKKSKCFVMTQNNPDYKPLTCLGCHFTSSMRHISASQTPVDTFNAQCISCHSKENQASCREKPDIREKENNNCIRCHMPFTGVFDIPHVAIYDHYIRINDKWKKPIKSTNEINTGEFLGLKCMTSDNPDKLTTARAFYLHYEKFNSLPSLLDSAYFYLKDYPEEEYLKYWVYYYYLKQAYFKVTDLALKHNANIVEDATLHYQLGQSYQNTGVLKSAIKEYRLAVKYQPYNLDYLNKLGSAYLADNDPQIAKQVFEKIIKLNPESTVALNNLGFVYLLDKNIQQAEALFRGALEYDPRYVNANLNLVKIHLVRNEILSAQRRMKLLKDWYPENNEVKEMDRVMELGLK